MKNAIYILLALFIIGVSGFIGYDEFFKEKPQTHTQTCERPESIPDTLYDGTDVYWDCKWQSFYNEGNVFIEWVNDDNHSEGAEYIWCIYSPNPPGFNNTLSSGF